MPLRSRGGSDPTLVPDHRDQTRAVKQLLRSAEGILYRPGSNQIFGLARDASRGMVDQSMINRKKGQLQSGRNTKLIEYVGHMVFHGALAQ